MVYGMRVCCRDGALLQDLRPSDGFRAEDVLVQTTIVIERRCARRGNSDTTLSSTLAIPVNAYKSSVV